MHSYAWSKCIYYRWQKWWLPLLTHDVNETEFSSSLSRVTRKKNRTFSNRLIRMQMNDNTSIDWFNMTSFDLSFLSPHLERILNLETKFSVFFFFFISPGFDRKRIKSEALLIDRQWRTRWETLVICQGDETGKMNARMFARDKSVLQLVSSSDIRFEIDRWQLIRVELFCTSDRAGQNTVRR